MQDKRNLEERITDGKKKKRNWDTILRKWKFDAVSLLGRRGVTSQKKQNLFIHQFCLYWSTKAQLNRLINKNPKPNLIG